MAKPSPTHPPAPIEHLLEDLLLDRNLPAPPDALLLYDWGDTEPFAVAVGEAECDNSTFLSIGREFPFARPTEPWEIDAESLADLLAQGGILLLDVRTAEEYARDHIPAARWVALEQLEAYLTDLGPDVPVVLVCRSGSRSGQAAAVCQQRGFRHVRHVCGGMLGWTGPTVAGGDEPAETVHGK